MDTNIFETLADIEKEINEVTKAANAKIAELQKPALKASVQLFAEIGWNNWSAPQLESADQYSRLQKSFSDKMNIESIDYTSKSGQVRSSSVYDINEKGCTCKDFAIRRLPCKHMYFLAFHLANDKDTQDLQIKLDEGADKKVDDNLSSDLGELGCCHLYRKCSEVGHCLVDDEYHKQCGYRKNLEKGQIFFTKNAANFSQERYDYIKSFRESLNENERRAFDEILLYFKKGKRGSRTCFCLSVPEIRIVVTQCKAFEILPPADLVNRIFGANLILNTKAAEFHSKYSKLSAPVLKPLPAALPQTATEKEKDIRRKEVQRINAENLQTWKKHYCIDHELQNVLADKFLYFKVNEYDFELEEFFIDNYDSLASDSSNLVTLDPDMPQAFKERIV